MTPAGKEAQLRPRLFYLYPEIHDSLQFSDDFYRAIFYLSPLVRRGDSILVPSDREDSPYGHPPAHFLDGCVAEMAEKLRDRVKVMPLARANVWFESFNGQRFICLWDETLRDKDPFLKRGEDVRLIRADHRRVQHASSLYLKASSSGGAGTKTQRAVSEQRLKVLLQGLKSDRVLLFGTGPTLEQVDFASLPKGVHVATNSMVKNRPLLDALQPKIIVASDPIFHAGASRYAQEFRTRLVEAMRRYDASFIFPMRDIGIYNTVLPEDVRDRLIGVPTTDKHAVNFDLFETFSVAATRNVMTHFLLPLAASLARETILIGFDGRRPHENTYFWSHSQSSQFTHEMPIIQEAHPAFFAIDYDAYYREHCERVDFYLKRMEALRRTVISLTDSHIPAIRGRFVSRLAERPSTLSRKRPRISIVMPIVAGLSHFKLALASVQEQSVSDWELLCVDCRKSLDQETRSWLDQEMERDPRIRHFEHEGGGLADALNAGLVGAKGRMLTFLLSSDRMLPDALKRRLQLLRSEPGLEVCGGRVELIDRHGNSLNLRGGRQQAARLRHARAPLFNLSTLFGRAQVMKRFRFDPFRPYEETWHYCTEMLQHGWIIGSCGEEPLAEVRYLEELKPFGDPLGRFASTRLILDELIHPPRTPLFEKGIPVVLSEIQIARSKERYLQALFVAQVLLGDRAGEETVLDIMREQPPVAFLQPVEPRFFEAVATRALMQPQKSTALYRRIMDRYEAIFDACDRLGHSPAHRDFAVSFCKFAMQVCRDLALREGIKLRNGEAERRVRRQALLMWGRTHLHRAGVQAGGAVRVVNGSVREGWGQTMEAQRDLRRRWRRWRRQHKQRTQGEHLSG